MDMHAVRRKNLRELITSQGDGSVASFARTSGFTEARLSQLLSVSFRHGQNFGEKMARKIEQQCGLPPLSLDTVPEDLNSLGREQGWAKHVPSSIRSRNGPTTRDIEIYNLAIKPDNSGFDMSNELYRGDYEKVGIRYSWMYGNNFEAKNLIATKIREDSMAPSLFSGDVVVINLADTTLADGAVLLFGYEGEIIIRRVNRDAGQWWLVADNTDQRRFARKVFHDDGILPIGRVVLRETQHI
jgi:phage repressor protein C with HTH and peptisase S24 domain